MTLILVAYGVSTMTTAGKRRLRRVAKVCQNYGQRVQNSVFECWVDNAQWISLRAAASAEIDPSSDSLRFYFLGDHWRGRIEHIGAKASYDPEGPLIL